MKNKKRYYMDEDDFKTPETEPEFEHLVPKSFVAAERRAKNKLVKALDKIEVISNSVTGRSHLTSADLANTYASAINEILNVIKDVDIHNKRCED